MIMCQLNLQPGRCFCKLSLRHIPYANSSAISPFLRMLGALPNENEQRNTIRCSRTTESTDRATLESVAPSTATSVAGTGIQFSIHGAHRRCRGDKRHVGAFAPRVRLRLSQVWSPSQFMRMTDSPTLIATNWLTLRGANSCVSIGKNCTSSLRCHTGLPSRLRPSGALSRSDCRSSRMSLGPVCRRLGPKPNTRLRTIKGNLVSQFGAGCCGLGSDNRLPSYRGHRGTD